MSQMANRKLSCAMLYRWFKCKLKPPKKRGRAKRVLSHFCRHVKRSIGNLRKVAPLSLNCFGRFSVLIPPYLFTVHVRPVLSPCQASNTCSNMYTIDNIINTICTHNVYNIMFSTAIYIGDHRIFAQPIIVIIHNKIYAFIILQTSLIIYLNTL